MPGGSIFLGKIDYAAGTYDPQAYNERFDMRLVPALMEEAEKVVNNRRPHSRFLFPTNRESRESFFGDRYDGSPIQHGSRNILPRGLTSEFSSAGPRLIQADAAPTRPPDTVSAVAFGASLDTTLD